VLYRLLLYLWRVLPLPERLRWFVVRQGNVRFLAGAAALILDEQGRVLLFRHTYRRREPWGLPGGWIGRGERPEEGLIRELREEGGLDISVERLLLADIDVSYRHIDLIYLCRIGGGVFRPSAEIDAYAYAAPDALPAMHHVQRAQLARALDVAAASRIAP
jgi:ADP-ribose pyrophosphatase YjhB (NUDIX family)